MDTFARLRHSLRPERKRDRTDSGHIRTRNCAHGVRMAGRSVGLSYDGPIVTSWGAMARTEEEALAVMAHLKEKGVPSA